MEECKHTQSVNKPMGEAYSAYWNKWLERGASAAHPVLGSQAEAAPPSAIDIFNQLYEHAGGEAVFKIARQNSQMSGFDIQSLLFSSAPDPATLVKRWQKVAHAQATIRFCTKQMQPDFIQILPSGEIVLSPSRIRPANRSKFGAAMLAGVVANALSQFAVEPVQIFEVLKTGTTRELKSVKDQTTLDFDPTSDIVFRMTSEVSRNETHAAPSPFLNLNHLFNHTGHPLFRQMIAWLDQQSGEHTNVEHCAHQLGMSVRTLSRRLKSHDLTYGGLVRFIRLRNAARLMSAGETKMDDVAYFANYADRHHMARDFRQMVQISPTLLRDLFADSTPAKITS